MRTDLPTSIQDTHLDLSVEALVHLYRIELTDNTTFLLSPQKEVTWRGQVYEEVPCHMSGFGQHSDAKVNRPRFTFANPAGIFTQPLYDGRMDNASITRIRVLSSDLLADNDFSVEETYRVSRIITIAKNMAIVEMRDALDGHHFKLPARQFIPPEFPHVKLR